MTFHDFLSKIRPLVNASGLESAAGLPRNTLGKHYRWADGKPNGQPCHRSHFTAIVRALCAAFGIIEIDGWRITCEPDGPSIFAIRPIPEREVEIKEIQNGSTVLYEYKEQQWRRHYDDFDFSQYFSG